MTRNVVALSFVLSQLCLLQRYTFKLRYLYNLTPVYSLRDRERCSSKKHICNVGEPRERRLLVCINGPEACTYPLLLRPYECQAGRNHSSMTDKGAIDFHLPSRCKLCNRERLELGTPQKKSVYVEKLGPFTKSEPYCRVKIPFQIPQFIFFQAYFPAHIHLASFSQLSRLDRHYQGR